jgi:DNA polymerase-3 subunit epsilon
LTDEAFPRLTITRAPPETGRAHLGPFRSVAAARRAVEALQAAVPIRCCTQRLPRRPHASPCALYELGRCGAPCAGHETAADYARHVAAVSALFEGRSDAPIAGMNDAMLRLAAAGRFARAAELRDQMARLVEALAAGQHLDAGAGIAEIVAARPDGSGGW